MAFVDFAPPILAGLLGAATAIVAGQIANRNAERREARNRAADEHRERLRDLRAVTDDAARAMRDMWTVLGAFAYAIPRGDPPTSRRSPTEAREPDADSFIEVYERLTDAHVRLLNRVEWGDTLHSPIGRAVIDVQQAYNAVVHEDPYEPRANQSANAILKAIGSAARIAGATGNCARKVRSSWSEGFSLRGHARSHGQAARTPNRRTVGGSQA
jgi:hypothetical protein